MISMRSWRAILVAVGVLSGSANLALAGVGAPGPAGLIGDFDGDGKSDILLLNTTAGSLQIWFMQALNITANAGFGDPLDWVVRGAADFNADSSDDIVWQNVSTGAVLVWLMSGSTISSAPTIGVPTSGYVVVGTGDFDDDGSPDLLFRNGSTGDLAVWFLNGTSFDGGGSVGNPGTAFQVAAVGDFDNANGDDLFLVNSTGGSEAYAVWLLDGLAIQAGSGGAAFPAGWSVIGAADYDIDGDADAVLQNAGSSEVLIWLMTGSNVSGFSVVGTPSPATPLDQLGNFNGAAEADLLFRAANGDISMWLMNLTSFRRGGLIATPGSSWSVVTSGE